MEAAWQTEKLSKSNSKCYKGEKIGHCKLTVIVETFKYQALGPYNKLNQNLR